MKNKGLHRELKKERKSLLIRLAKVTGIIQELFGPSESPKKRKKMSAKGRAAIRAAQRARGAKIKAAKNK
jgi:hypothetical protein